LRSFRGVPLWGGLLLWLVLECGCGGQKFSSFAADPPLATSSSGVRVTVQSPISGATASSPVQFAATAASPHSITGFVVYANNQNVYQTNGSSLNANVALSTGTYSVYIRAWDSTGTYGTSPPFSITVAVSTLPTPPPTAVVYASIDDSTSGWGSCGTASCAGGASDASSWPMYQFQTTPSLDGASTELVLTGPPYADALHWYKLPPQNWATNYLWDSWTYLDDASLSAQAIEFDVFTVVPIGGVNRKFMFGSQCNYASGVWDGWAENTSGGGTWVPTNIPCTKFSPNTWHHVVWYFTRVGTNLDQLKYVSLTVDGATYSVNIPLQPSQATSWNQVLGVQYQQDLGPSGTPFHQWIDEVKLTIW
jgi:hypothetical protein